MLVQEDHLMAFESRKVSEIESQNSGELFVVVHCLRMWRRCLLGSKFIVKSVNVVVSHFVTQKKLTSK